MKNLNPISIIILAVFLFVGLTLLMGETSMDAPWYNPWLHAFFKFMGVLISLGGVALAVKVQQTTD